MDVWINPESGRLGSKEIGLARGSMLFLILSLSRYYQFDSFRTAASNEFRINPSFLPARFLPVRSSSRKKGATCGARGERSNRT